MAQIGIPKCAVKNCRHQATKTITYDCRPEPDQVIDLCDDYAEHDEVFGQHIKSVVPIRVGMN